MTIRYTAPCYQQQTEVVTVSGDVTAPPWATLADVELIGGGGGAGGAGSQATAGDQQVGGGGGAAGQFLPVKGIPVVGGTVYPITIGAGGVGGPGGPAAGNAGQNGSPGGQTEGFGLAAQGGGPGAPSAASDSGSAWGGAYALGTVPGAVANNDLNVNPVGWGGNASTGPQYNNVVQPLGPVIGGCGGGPSSTTLGGAGGKAAQAPGTVPSPPGIGEEAGTAGGNGQDALVPGCGGGGGGGGAGTTGAGGDGGDGANGQVTITWRSE